MSKPHAKIVATATCLLAGITSFPPDVGADADWSDYARVEELVPTGRHYYEFRLGAENNPSGCREAQWFYQNYDAPGAEKMFDLLLESLKSNLSVRVYVTGVCNLNGYAEISSVSIRPE